MAVIDEGALTAAAKTREFPSRRLDAYSDRYGRAGPPLRSV
jgi:hypothetical protein